MFQNRCFHTQLQKAVLLHPHCGYVLPKKEAKISGWDSQSSLRHVHCPKCGKIITHTP